jgi:16S rRNA (cytosine967-C5)-methyltransferase
VDTGRSLAKSSGRRPRRPAADGSEGPRGLALRVIRRVTEQGAYSNLALAGELGRAHLAPADRRLAADLAYGTIRRLLVLDRSVAAAAGRPVGAIDPESLALLRLGAYQLLCTRIPAHAAVGETVELAGRRPRGFVNAVLRAISANPPPAAKGGDDAAVSARTGLAPWAVAELRVLLPGEEVEDAAGALASAAPLCVRTNTCAVSTERLEQALRVAGHSPRRGLHHPDTLWISAATPAALPGYREGWFVVQDEASAIVASALPAAPGERVLDACAAPGGKAIALACGVGPGGMVVAADALPKRLSLVRKAAGRVGLPLLLVAQDARRTALRGPFDAVLVDAPCSGMGAARRRPELLWRPARADLARLARLQVAILLGVADLLVPGGRLVYSVCTFPRAETDAVVRAFLGKRSDFEPMAVDGPGGEGPTHRLWPHRHGTDAMFYAGFQRRRGRG